MSLFLRRKEKVLDSEERTCSGPNEFFVTRYTKRFVSETKKFNRLPANSLTAVSHNNLFSIPLLFPLHAFILSPCDEPTHHLIKYDSIGDISSRLIARNNVS